MQYKESIIADSRTFIQQKKTQQTDILFDNHDVQYRNNNM